MFQFLKNGRIKDFLALLSLRPFDTSTEEGRAQERHRRILLSAAVSVLAKVISVATTLITVPLTLGYLGAERYGMWMTMSSVIIMMSFADLGIGNGVLSTVADANGRNDKQAIRQIISSGFLILSLVAVVILLSFYVAYPRVLWYKIFNIHNAAARADVAPALAVFVCIFAISIPLNIVQRVQIGLQRSFNNSLWQCVGSILGLCAVVLVIHWEGSIQWLVGALLGGPLIVVVCNNLYFFLKTHSDLMPSFRFVSKKTMHHIVSTGFLFFVLQIVVAVAYTSDNIVIAQKMGASHVAEYSVTDKFFSVIPLILGVIMAPLWPAYGEAKSRGDRRWIIKTLKRSLIIAASCSVSFSLFLVLFAKNLIPLWVGDSINPPLILLLGFGVWKVLEAVGSATAMFLNGLHVVRFQLIVAIITAIASLSLKIIFIDYIGVAGAIWGSIFAYSIFSIIPIFLYIRKNIRDI